MKLARRRFLHLAAVATALPAVTRIAKAQVYPARPVRFVVNLAPGGGLDFMARLIGEHLSRSMGQQVVIENKPGAGGMLGAETVAKSPPDGYTVLATTDVITSAPHIMSFNVDYVRELVPVIELTLQPVVLAAHPSLGVNSMAELIWVAKQRPGIGYATSGAGTQQHFVGEWLAQAAQIKLGHVPYRGAGQAINDLIAGRTTRPEPCGCWRNRRRSAHRAFPRCRHSRKLVQRALFLMCGRACSCPPGHHQSS